MRPWVLWRVLQGCYKHFRWGGTGSLREEFSCSYKVSTVLPAPLKVNKKFQERYMLMSLSMSKQLRFNRMLCKEKQKREKSAQEYLWVEQFIPKQQLYYSYVIPPFSHLAQIFSQPKFKETMSGSSVGAWAGAPSYRAPPPHHTHQKNVKNEFPRFTS